jgi:murein DD-endopeptidase MepM/ murein hydrolase activator NlpD
VGLLAAVSLVLAAPAGAHTSDPMQLELRWPATGTVTSPFGWTEGRHHPGLDIGILRSLEVTASAPGRVTLAGTPRGYEGYGTVVAVDVGAPYSTLYAHLERPVVHRGEWVTSGQRLGIAGCTGWCTGTHLHFELRQAGVPIDPLTLLVPWRG